MSRNLPSRGERESAGTTREIGFFFEPTRVSLSFTAICVLSAPAPFLLALGRCLPRRGGRARRLLGREGRHLPPPHLLHHSLHLLACLEQLVDLLDGRAGALGDANPPLAVDHDRRTALLRRHRKPDPPAPRPAPAAA